MCSKTKLSRCDRYQIQGSRLPHAPCHPAQFNISSRSTMYGHDPTPKLRKKDRLLQYQIRVPTPTSTNITSAKRGKHPYPNKLLPAGGSIGQETGHQSSNKSLSKATQELAANATQPRCEQIPAARQNNGSEDPDKTPRQEDLVESNRNKQRRDDGESHRNRWSGAARESDSNRG